MFIRRCLWDNNSGKKRSNLDGKRGKLGSNGGLNNHLSLLYRVAVQLK